MILSLFLLQSAAATTLTERATETVEPGVTLTEYRASSPSTDIWVLRVDLCADDVYVDATQGSATATGPPGAGRRTWT